MFSTGRIIFALSFITVFIAYLIWAYRKDIAKTPWYYKGTLLIILVFILIYSAYFVLTRWAMAQ